MIDLQRGARAASGPLTGRRILVVDDDAGVREACAETLMAEGSEVVQATDGLDALARLEQEPFDLVLSERQRIGTIYFLMSEENVAMQIAQPWIKFGTDAGGSGSANRHGRVRLEGRHGPNGEPV